MKRMLIMIMLFSLILGLLACNENEIIESDISKEFKSFIKDLDAEIDKDTDLPSKFNDLSVSYVYQDELIEKISYPYSNKDINMTLEVSIVDGDKQIKETKEILIKKSPIIHDLYVSTENYLQIDSKETYIKGQVSLTNDGPFKQEGLSMKIKGRGNSTWMYPKKPYRIKFDERQSLLGMASAKDYVLLAEYNDKSLMRNYLAHYFSQFLNYDHHLETRYVSLYLNDVYQGIYLLTEQVEVDKNRLDIDESDLADGGFLIELETDDRIDQEGIEDINWFKAGGKNFVIKSPDMEDYEPGVVANKISFMKNYINDFLLSIEVDFYEAYIDVDSFIDYFILSELFKQVDVGYSSVYAHKDLNEKLAMGPSWDFDISSGNGDYYDYGPFGYWVDYNPWFKSLIQRPSFEMLYTNRFIEVMDLHFDDLIAEIDYVSALLAPYASDNFKTWDILGIYIWPNPQEMVAANTYSKQITYLKNYLISREQWLTSELKTKGYYID